MENYTALGLMSGTSLDGLDIAHVHFNRNSNDVWSFKIINGETVPYPNEWKLKLQEAYIKGANEVFQLHTDYGHYLGEAVSEFLKKHKIEKLDLISSHGHTLFHQPAKGYTVQIGDARAIQKLNPFPVVYDFRSQDVLLGGQGAPLVPIGDELLFSSYNACLNLGGFSNISFRWENNRIAFDISPVGTVLNHYAQKLRFAYDAEGKIAKEAGFSQEKLDQLNQLEFYFAQGPKSLGIEFVHDKVYPLLDPLSPREAIGVFTEHTAFQIAQILNKYKLDSVLVTGGGAFNSYLLKRIEHHCSSKLILPEREVIELKEALIFAFMGVLRIRKQNNVLSSVTGAEKDHCSGLLVD